LCLVRCADDGNNKDAPQIGRFAGSSVPSDIRSTTGHVYIRLTSDGSAAGSGFHAVVLCHSIRGACHATHTGEDATCCTTGTGVCTRASTCMCHPANRRELRHYSGGSCWGCVAPSQSSDGHFAITGTPVRFAAADATCADLGRHVATVQSSTEDRAVKQLLGSDSAWIGLTDTGREGHFVWTDGGSTSHRNWNSGEPNDSSGEDCVEAQGSGGWNDLDCGTDRRVVCARDGDCIAGWYRSSGTCQSCTSGQYQPNSGRSVCINCGSGQYNSDTAATTCHSCSSGKYQPNSGHSACISCDSGHYNSNTAATSCHSCQSGQYQPNSGHSVCINCGSGHYSDTAATSCHSCPSGKYQPNSGHSACISCDSGHYNNNTAATSCHSCQSGQYQPNFEQSACISCGSGHYSDTAATSCHSCPSGKYQPNGGQSSCISGVLGDDAAETSYGTIICAAVLAILGLVGVTLGLRKVLKVTGADRAYIT
jgi:hypothetical protein